MAEFSELVHALTWLLTNRVQQKIEYTHELLGDGNGRVRVSTIPGSPEVDYVFVRPDRFSNRAYKVFNKRIEGQDGDPIIVGELPWEPELVQVIDMDWQAYADVGWGDDVTTTNRHGNSHQWRDAAPGIDTFNVYRRQFGDLKTYATTSGTLAVGVSPYSLDLFGKQYQWPGTQAFDLGGALPTTTGTARMALVYWSPASGTTQGFLGVATGTLGSGAEATILNRPVSPQGVIPSAFVRLAGGQSSITEFDIWDAREPFRPGLSFGTGTAGLSADMIPISDTSGLYTGSTIEAALDQIGFDGARVSKVFQSDFDDVAFQADADGNVLGSKAISADNFSFIVENTSGATATANDVGFIDEAGEYKTTTTAQDEVSWCVVIVGGANNADIYVARRGRVTVSYTGSAPSAGDFLVTSTSAGDALQQPTMRPEIFAIALAGGAGGVVSALLLCQRKANPITPDDSLLFVNLADASDFVSAIAVAGVSGDKIYYDPPSSGGVAAITPFAATELAKIVIHNTTQVLEAFIIDTGTDGTGNFIQVSAAADISGWVATDVIVTRSQTNTSVIGSSRWFDLFISSSLVPELTTALAITVSYRDTGVIGNRMFSHPFQTNNNNKRQNTLGVSTSDNLNVIHIIGLFEKRLCVLWEASGSGTAIPLIRVREIIVAAP
jgi:hypothetical protein